MTRRRIDASHVIAYQDGGHRYLRDGEVVVDGSDIVHVGPQGSWREPVDETIDASGMVLTPGFINTHAHLADSPLDKSFVEDMGRRQFYLSGLFEYLPVRSQAMDEAAANAGLAYSMAELLRTGTTTETVTAVPRPRTRDVAASAAPSTPGARSARASK